MASSAVFVALAGTSNGGAVDELTEAGSSFGQAIVCTCFILFDLEAVVQSALLLNVVRVSRIARR